jgi:hypothetical protein
MFRLNIDSVLANGCYAAKPAKAAKAANLQPHQELAGLAKLAGLAVSSPPANEPFPVLDELLTAALRACDYWGDDYACHAIPPDKRQDWIDYFVQQYPK